MSLLPLTPVPFLTKAVVLLPGSLTSGERQFQRLLSDVCVTLCIELTEVEPECVGTISITPLLLDPQGHPSLALTTPSLLSPQLPVHEAKWELRTLSWASGWRGPGEGKLPEKRDQGC